MSHDARAIANFLLDYADSRDIGVSHLSLQKILYFLQGWHLCRLEAPIFENPIEAWKYGPVVRVVYDSFKEFKNGKKISTRARKIDLRTGNSERVLYNLSDSEEEFSREIFNFYCRIDAYKLSRMTHELGSPWHNIWSQAEDNVVLGMEIPLSDIRNYFSHQIKNRSESLS